VEEAEYPYLTPRALHRLAEARQLAQATGLATRPSLIALGGDLHALLPWCGSRKLFTMTLHLSQGDGPWTLARAGRFHISITARSGGSEEMVAGLRALAGIPWVASEMVAKQPRLQCETGKYDEFLPEPLLKEAFAADRLDPQGARERFVKTMAG
jgi:ATP-dependent Lhr-like helicase